VTSVAQPDTTDVKNELRMRDADLRGVCAPVKSLRDAVWANPADPFRPSQPIAAAVAPPDTSMSATELEA
jgi:hypothetical protein